MKVHQLTLATGLLAALACLADSVPLIFEAESAFRVDGVFEFSRDPSMSGGLGLQVREGTGSDFDENQASQLKGLHVQVGFAADGGRAVYRFHVPEAGHYWVWARTYWQWECSNSFWIGEDPNASIIMTDKVHGRWHWVRANEPVAMAAGTEDFAISNREDGIQIDQFCLTRDRQFRPQGRLEANVLIPRAKTPMPLLLRPTMQTPVVFPNADTAIVLWVRNPGDHPRTIRVAADCDSALEMKGVEQGAIELQARSGLVGVAWSVRARGDIPFQRSQVRFTVTCEDGQETTASCTLVHACQWEAAGPFQRDIPNAPPPPPWRQAGPQTAPPPAATLQNLAWKAIADPDLLTGTGRMDLQRIFGQHVTAAWGYLRADVEWPHDEHLPVELRSDDQSVVWVNGECVAAHRVIGPGERYYTRCNLPFRQGVNTLLIAVNQVQAFWEVSLMPVPKAAGEATEQDR